MNCYHIVTQDTENAILTKDERYILLSECTEAEEASVNAAVASWILHNDWEWSCVADNDNGIDDRQSGENELKLLVENIIVESGEAVGYYINNAERCLLFNEINIKGKNVVRTVEESWTGGWGTTYNESNFSLRAVSAGK